MDAQSSRENLQSRDRHTLESIEREIRAKREQLRALELRAETYRRILSVNLELSQLRADR